MRKNCNETQSPAGRAGDNTAMEPELNALCADLAPVPARTLVLSDWPDYRQATLDAVNPFIGQKPDLAVYA